MQTHPFIGSVINRVMGITLSVVAWMMYSWLLFCYGGEEIWIACLDGLVSVGLLAAAGFLYGYVDGTIHALQIQVALAVLVQAISLAGAFELQVLLEHALYHSRHAIENLTGTGPERAYTIGGTVCESSDIFARDLSLPELRRGDLLSIKTAGAYGAAMASRYNLHDLPQAVFSDEL